MDVVVIISADTEWKAVKYQFAELKIDRTPFGEYFGDQIELSDHEIDIVFMHGGWGKISAAASAQYAIDHWNPKLLVNLGTCGGIAGQIEVGDILLVERTLVYDIYEQMGDAESHRDHYRVDLDLSWLQKPFPSQVRPGLLVSADRDLVPGEIEQLSREYGAPAGDWESGAIAFVAVRNRTPCLILRGVSDLVSEGGGEAYGNQAMFESSAEKIMHRLVKLLPELLAGAAVLK